MYKGIDDNGIILSYQPKPERHNPYMYSNATDPSSLSPEQRAVWESCKREFELTDSPEDLPLIDACYRKRVSEGAVASQSGVTFWDKLFGWAGKLEGAFGVQDPVSGTESGYPYEYQFGRPDTKATSGMPQWAKIALIGTGIVVVGYGVYRIATKDK